MYLPYFFVCLMLIFHCRSLCTAYSKSPRSFNFYHTRFCRRREYKEWIDDIPLHQWALLYDGGYRYGHMTTNLSECVNSVLKGTRSLPITAIVRTIFHRLSALFADKGRDAQNQLRGGHVFSEFIRDVLRNNEEGSRIVNIREFSHTNQIF